MERNLKKNINSMYIHIYKQNHFAVHLKLTQYYKQLSFNLKKNFPPQENSLKLHVVINIS